MKGMKGRSEKRVKWLSMAGIVWIIIAVIILCVSIGMSFISKGFWFLMLAEAIPMIALIILRQEDDFMWNNDLVVDWTFNSLDNGWHKVKIIEYQEEYFRAYHFMGVYLREDTGYKTVEELIEKTTPKKEEKENCTIIGDL